MRNSL